MKTMKTLGKIECKTSTGASSEIDFKEFLLLCMDQHEPFGKGFAGIRQAHKIALAIESANGEIEMEDADYQALRSAVEGAKLNPAVARQLLSFYDEVEAAK